MSQLKDVCLPEGKCQTMPMDGNQLRRKMEAWLCDSCDTVKQNRYKHRATEKSVQQVRVEVSLLGEHGCFSL